MVHAEELTWALKTQIHSSVQRWLQKLHSMPGFTSCRLHGFWVILPSRFFYQGQLLCPYLPHYLQRFSKQAQTSFTLESFTSNKCKNSYRSRPKFIKQKCYKNFRSLINVFTIIFNSPQTNFFYYFSIIYSIILKFSTMKFHLLRYELKSVQILLSYD